MRENNTGMAIQVLPKSNNDSEHKVIEIVDEVIAYLKSTGLSVFVGPFETTIEGDLEQLMEIALRVQKICIEKGANSVATYMKVFYSPYEGVLSTDEKISKHHNKV